MIYFIFRNFSYTKISVLLNTLDNKKYSQNPNHLILANIRPMNTNLKSKFADWFFFLGIVGAYSTYNAFN